ncbi:MAG TPA: UDP-3-O-(3-hydroxymyristoyl)glucosamine N-acyltransferase [Dissulfurispiraceae bacterium]|nr:UDP-3-O-(3-hydroxymyristoyl)glucosamine N-acyltransferase [Dissulfurispiraceae bacterium]
MKLSEIALFLEGRITGDGDTDITGVAGLSEAKAGDITFIGSGKFIKEARTSPATALIVREFIEDIEKPQIACINPQLAFAKLLGYFYVKPHPYLGVSEKAVVSPTANIGENATIYPFAYIAEHAIIGKRSVIYPGVYIGAGSSIGEACTIYPNATIREGVTVGSRVIIHAGAVVGADGFGFVFDGRSHVKIPQVGRVIIEDDVEIGANTTIDRATTGSTVIGCGTKIDNQVQIGHNVQIGRGAILVAQVGIGGSSTVGDGVVLGGQAGIADHTEIEAGTMLGAKGGFMGKVSKGIYSGGPAIPHRDWLKSTAIFAQLPELKKKIHELEEQIKTLKCNGGKSGSDRQQ